MIVVDVETTGVDPRRHAIVSIGALEFAKPKNQFYGEAKIDSSVEVHPTALEVNGFTLEQINDPTKPTLTDLIIQFTKWMLPISDKTLAGHNTGFDVGMLWAAYRKANLEVPFGYRHIDLHSLVYISMLKHAQPVPQYKNRTSITSDTALEYVGLPQEPRPHQGLVGAKMEAEAMSRIIHGENLLSEFKQYPLPDYLKA